MRHEFYGDRKDIWKWSYLLEAARPNRNIVHVVMLRDDRGKHGNDFGSPGQHGHPAVIKFFDVERRHFSPGGKRDLSRVRFLLPDRIVLTEQAFHHKERAGYFENVADSLRRRDVGCHSVVFLDPDNGIAGARCKGEHVNCDELTLIWDNLVPGDTLVIYQHRFRDRDWRAKRQLAAESALGVKVSEIREHPAVCFFRFDKS